MPYPKLKKQYLKSELFEFFKVTDEELSFISNARPKKDKNRLGFSSFLKSYQLLGYPPRQKSDIHKEIVEWIAHQIDISPSLFKEYDWKSRVWERHLALIRTFTGFRVGQFDDHQELSRWLIEKAGQANSETELLNAAIHKCRERMLELPSENELRRLVNSSRQKFFERFYQNVLNKAGSNAQRLMEKCLEEAEKEGERYCWIKSKPDRLGMKSILEEIKKLKFLKEFHIEPGICFDGISPEILQQLKNRAYPEDSYQMRRHPLAIRCTLMSVLIHFRQMEVTDNIVRLFLELIRKIEKKADTSMEKKLIRNIKKVFRKNKILYKIARASMENPEGTVREVIFTEVGEEILSRIVAEFEGESQEADYEKARARTMKIKYGRHYRRMLKPVLETLEFRANNPAHQPILEGLELVRKYMSTRRNYYPENEKIPEKLLTGHWKDLVEKVLRQDGLLGRMKQEDFQALTPLFTLNINPYGYFALDFDKPSILEAA